MVTVKAGNSSRGCNDLKLREIGLLCFLCVSLFVFQRTFHTGLDLQTGKLRGGTDERTKKGGYEGLIRLKQEEIAELRHELTSGGQGTEGNLGVWKQAVEERDAIINRMHVDEAKRSAEIAGLDAMLKARRIGSGSELPNLGEAKRGATATATYSIPT